MRLCLVWPASSIRGQTVSSLDDLARLTPLQLNAVYSSASAGEAPVGRVRGLPLVMPGSRFAVPFSRAGRVYWQGKIFEPETGMAVNRFLGLRMIRGRYRFGPSQFDGASALILDYQNTSRVYGSYRDEIREVSPGIHLGLMYDRRKPESGPVRYFAFQAER